MGEKPSAFLHHVDMKKYCTGLMLPPADNPGPMRFSTDLRTFAPFDPDEGTLVGRGDGNCSADRNITEMFDFFPSRLVHCGLLFLFSLPNISRSKEFAAAVFCIFCINPSFLCTKRDGKRFATA